MSVGLSDRLDRVLGAKSAKPLAVNFGLHTVGDLLRYYPRRYVERGELTPIADLREGQHVTVLAEVVKFSSRRMMRRKGTIQELIIWDGGQRLNLTFFNQNHMHRTLTEGRRGLFAGQVSKYKGDLQLLHPAYQVVGEHDDRLEEFSRALLPVYSATRKFNSWNVQLCVRQIFDQLDEQPEPLPEPLRQELGLMRFDEAIRAVHQSDDRAEIERARDRLKWDEAFVVQLTLARRRAAGRHRPAPRCPRVPDGLAAAFDTALPFDLTAGQSEVGEQLAEELAGDHPMNRLLQGEVGSGKTVVALRAMLQVVDAGRQAALLAPTEVLAAQHARTLREMLGPLGMAGELGAADPSTKITMLTGSLPAKARKQALLDIASGAAGIVVGTHALIQEQVSFADLGMVVVDEQHRFGVEQRDALRARAGEHTSPHVLVMTATPIPRTVAMTVYGDLDISSLRELPHGRSSISTTVIPTAEKPGWLDRAWRRIVEEVEAGRQAYVVCPRIGGDDDNGGADGHNGADGQNGADVASADGEEEARRPPLAVLDVAPQLIDGPLHEQRVGVLHGRLPTDAKDLVMRRFAAGDLDVLVATTVIEVGVDVPNATVMVIMDADRFGVSQLHQLRGRVGRGAHPGLCLLVTDATAAAPAMQRLSAVAETMDGFQLARLDLEQRREGDVLGAVQAGRQSGLKLLSLLRDEELIGQARVHAQRLIGDDPKLAAHPALAELVDQLLVEDRAEYLEKV